MSGLDPTTLPGPRARRPAGPPFVLGLILVLAFLALGACVVEPEEESAEAEATAPRASTTGAPRGEASTPLVGWAELDRERLEQERLDRSWERFAVQDRELRATGSEGAAAGTAAPESPSPGNPYLARLREEGPGSAGGTAEPPREAEDPGRGGETDARTSTPAAAPESWDDISPEALREGQPRFPVATDEGGGGPTIFRVQWLLDRVRFSPGVIDGRWGKNTEKAVYWLQDSLGMEPTGTIDRDLYEHLAAAVEERSPVREYTVTAEDLEGPFTDVPDEPEAQAELECLCYASPREAIAERFHITAELLAQLNPDVDLGGLRRGQTLWVPAVEVMEPDERGASPAEPAIDRIVISRGGFYLHALDASGRILYHFPSTLGSRYSPSPDGTFEVEGVGWRPDFHYQPKLFREVPDSEEDLLLPPGPNSPVGLVWMQLSKDGYGIHGTARPETIGYTTSHGCIRLTNWDAVFLGHRVAPGVRVEFRS